jgi:alkylation response protein AidB-like acyl-CoA dehydrogenase
MFRQDSPREAAFRQEVRGWLEANLPQDLRGHTARPPPAELMPWYRKLSERGWIAPHWPKSYGGMGGSLGEQIVLAEEMARISAPQLPVQGVNHLGPILMRFGNAEQKAKHLPPILRGDVIWAQGYSEPGAGSDLANLKCRAVREGDCYIVNGQKTWTTLAQFADWIFCLVRTDPGVKPQEGISFLLIDMKTPGITVKPIIVLDGVREVNEVFFDNVKVPMENRVGEENKGWTYAKFLLVNERSGIAGVARSKKAIERLKQIAEAETEDGRPLISTDEFSRKVAETEIELSALEFTELRTLAKEARGQMAGPESSILKIKGTEIQQRITELTLEAIGYYAYPNAHAFGDNEYPVGPDYAVGQAGHYFNMRKASIYGGSNEIQRDIIAKAVLGL